MPRRNRPKRRRHVPPEFKGKGMKRPKHWHHGLDRDLHFFEADQRLRQAEEDQAA